MTWKGYKVKWCETCHVPYIVCPKCHNSTCNGGGCDFCHDIFDEFLKSKTHDLPKFTITNKDEYDK